MEKEEEVIKEDSNTVLKPKSKQPRIIVNLFNTDYEVVKTVMKDIFEFRISKNPESDWDLLWADTGITDEILAKVKAYQKINHYPSMWCITKKNHLGKNLMRMRREYPKDYNFFPLTWLLPCDWNDFRTQLIQQSTRTYIVKPESLSQGKGIFITKNCESLDINDHYVVQRYINKPYLIEGLKFDLRVYVLVYGCDPLRVYMYKEGLVRLASRKYLIPNNGNINDLYIHLTNYAINKNNEEYIFNNDADNADTGHKRSLSFLWKFIDANGGNSKIVIQRIKDAIVKTLCAVQPQLAYGYRTCQPSDDKNNKCFEILGFDILLDHKLKPWLLEVNHTPSFSTDTPFDKKVKSELLKDTIILLNMNPMKRVKYYQKRNANMEKRYLSKGNKKLTKEERKDKKIHYMQKKDKYELEHCGNYERIYPDIKDPCKYEAFIETATKIWDKLYGPKIRSVPKPETERKSIKKPSEIKVFKHINTSSRVVRISICNTERNRRIHQIESAQKVKVKERNNESLHLPPINKPKSTVDKSVSENIYHKRTTDQLESSIGTYPTKRFEKVNLRTNEKSNNAFIRIIRKDDLHTEPHNRESMNLRLKRKEIDLPKLNLSPRDELRYMNHPIGFPATSRYKRQNIITNKNNLNGNVGKYVLPKMLELLPKGFVMQDWKMSK